jgi:soluble lytic murein transglycosylase-like protein
MRIAVAITCAASALAWSSFSAEAGSRHRHHHQRHAITAPAATDSAEAVDAMASASANGQPQAESQTMMAFAPMAADVINEQAKTPIEGRSLKALVARHAQANGLPVALADAIVMIESRYNPRVAHRGAMGLMQIKTQTARGVGFAGSASALLDPDTNLKFGMRYLAAAYRASNGNVCATIMRYQSGARATRISAANRAYCAHAQRLMRGA